MKKVLLATLLAFLGAAVVTDASAWFGRSRCGIRNCERSCAPRCEKSCAVETPVNITRVDERPCGPAPCCLTAVQIPANLVKHVEYSWECPTGCTVQSGSDATY